MKQAKYYNALNNLYGGDYSKLRKAWERFGGWEKAWNSEKDAGTDIEKEWQELEGRKISLILKEDDNYPALLKEIPFPPFGIYVLGNIGFKQPALAVVGTRAATLRGKELAKAFSRALGRAGITIVSGLAMGIDESAHWGALEGDGITAAVLGTPLNYIYPRQNEKLASRIIEKGGAIISEFPFKQEYHPQNFLIRNRIISGLASAALIIEAPEKSGALATARFALEQNREVFVVPGGVGTKNYQGSNALLKSGAAAVTEAQDILDYFGIEAPHQAPAAQAINLSAGGDEGAIIAVLKNKGSRTAEELLKTADISVERLNKCLAMLVIKGIIKEINGRYHLPN